MFQKKPSASEVDGVQYRRAKLWQIICYACNAFVGMSVYSLIGMASYSASIGYGITTATVDLILMLARILDGSAAGRHPVCPALRGELGHPALQQLAVGRGRSPAPALEAAVQTGHDHPGGSAGSPDAGAARAVPAGRGDKDHPLPHRAAAEACDPPLPAPGRRPGAGGPPAPH